MKDYIFILGRDPELSILELASYLKARKTSYSIKKQDRAVAIISLEPQDFKLMISKLGGTTKIAEIIENLDAVEMVRTSSNKIKYAISLYDETDIEELKLYLKQRFRDEKLKAAYKKSKRKDPYMSPTEVVKLRLLEEGIEIIAYDGMTAKTIAVYNPLAYQERDSREENAISIKLAKILINLAGIPWGTITDPEGRGTIAREAKLMGYKQGTKTADAVVTALPMEDTPNIEKIKNVFQNYKTNTIILALPRVRAHRKLNIASLAEKNGFHLHNESKNIVLPYSYNAKKSRIERDIWVFKAKALNIKE